VIVAILWDDLLIAGDMPIEPGDSWFSAKTITVDASIFKILNTVKH